MGRLNAMLQFYPGGVKHIPRRNKPRNAYGRSSLRAL